MRILILFLITVSAAASAQQLDTIVLTKCDQARPLSLGRLHTIPPYRFAGEPYLYNRPVWGSENARPAGGMAPVILPLMFLCMGTAVALTDGLDSSGSIMGYSGFIITGTYTYVKFLKPKRKRRF